MRLAPLLVASLLLSACPQARPAGEEAPANAVPSQTAEAPRIVIAFAGTENDPWASEVAAAIGAALGFDPWAAGGQSNHLDTYGPYSGTLDGRAVSVALAMSGLAGISDLLSQQALGEDLRQWIEEQQPAVVWLDGDQLQLFTGRGMEAGLPLVFTGAVADREVYYPAGRPVTGVYKRHSLPGVMQEIWQRAPEAQRIALLGDGSPASEGQLLIFQSQLELAYFKDQPVIVGERVQSWPELRAQLAAVSQAADGIVLCAIGGPGSAPGFSSTPCPTDLLAGVRRPVVALGPSPLDHCGAVVLSLKPVEHVRYALLAVRDILGGKGAANVLPVTPPEMEVFQSDRGGSNQAEPAGAGTGGG